MEVILAEHAGFCFGVQRAVDTVYEQIKKRMKDGRPIYTCLLYTSDAADD